MENKRYGYCLEKNKLLPQHEWNKKCNYIIFYLKICSEYLNKSIIKGEKGFGCAC